MSHRSRSIVVVAQWIYYISNIYEHSRSIAQHSIKYYTRKTGNRYIITLAVNVCIYAESWLLLTSDHKYEACCKVVKAYIVRRCMCFILFWSRFIDGISIYIYIVQLVWYCGSVVSETIIVFSYKRNIYHVTQILAEQRLFCYIIIIGIHIEMLRCDWTWFEVFVQ